MKLIKCLGFLLVFFFVPTILFSTESYIADLYLTLTAANNSTMRMFFPPAAIDFNFRISQTQEFESGIQKNNKTGRAFLEAGITLAAITSYYWLNYSKYKVDWSFNLTWEDQRKRFFTLQAIRFDTNCFGTNLVHVPQGAGFYNIARTNDLNPFVSTLFSLSTELFWEYVSEWHEVVSINDIINSTFGGVAVGEPLYQLGRYFSGRPGPVSAILGILVDPVLAFNDLLDGKENGQAQDRSAAVADLRFYLGAKDGYFATNSAAYTHFDFGFETHLLKIPGFGEAGCFNSTLHDTMLSDLSAEFNLSASGVEEFSINSRAILYGFAGQDIQTQSSGRDSGWGYFAGIASAYDLMKKRSIAAYDSSSSDWFYVPGYKIQLPTKFTDKYSLLHILGPVGYFTVVLDGLKLDAALDAYFDFSMINALALNAYSVNHPISGFRSTLRNYGYYYGFGYTVNTAINLSWRPFLLKGALIYHVVGSVDGLDQMQSTVTNDTHLIDTNLICRASLEWSLSETFSLTIIAESNHRYGAIGACNANQTEHKLYYRMNFIF